MQDVLLHVPVVAVLVLLDAVLDVKDVKIVVQVDVALDVQMDAALDAQEAVVETVLVLVEIVVQELVQMDVQEAVQMVAILHVILDALVVPDHVLDHVQAVVLQDVLLNAHHHVQVLAMDAKTAVLHAVVAQMQIHMDLDVIKRRICFMACSGCTGACSSCSGTATFRAKTDSTLPITASVSIGYWKVIRNKKVGWSLLHPTFFNMSIAPKEITDVHPLLPCQLNRKQIDISILHGYTEISLLVGINRSYR